MMNTEMLKTVSLFQGMNESELHACLDALQAHVQHCRRGRLLLCAGDTAPGIGIVLSGSITIEQSTLPGDLSVLSHVGSGGIFAETYALLQTVPLMVDVRANEDCEILWLAVRSLYGNVSWQNKLNVNLLKVCAGKNLALSERSFHTAPKTIRARVLSYLSAEALRRRSNDFEIPFSRQQLADYLNVERTALSKELGKMQKDGLIQFRGRRFRLCMHDYHRHSV